MGKLGFVTSLLCGLLWAGAADAKVLEIYAQAQGGGGSGRGVSGTFKDEDFFHGAGGGSYGAKLGAEVLWLDGWVEHNQFNDGSLQGTWTQFMFGSDWDFPIGEEPEPGQKPKSFGQIGFAFGFGMGTTDRQVDPPLSNDEISDKGFVGQVSFGAEYRMNKVMAFGLNVPITYGYLWKNCPGCSANDENNQYQSVSAMAVLYLRFYLHVK